MKNRRNMIVKNRKKNLLTIIQIIELLEITIDNQIKCLQEKNKPLVDLATQLGKMSIK